MTLDEQILMNFLDNIPIVKNNSVHLNSQKGISHICFFMLNVLNHITIKIIKKGRDGRRKGGKETEKVLHLVSVKIPNQESRDRYSRLGSDLISPFSLE